MADFKRVAIDAGVPLDAVHVGHATAPIHADGRLDEADWANATVIKGFTSFMPDAGAEPDPDMEVRLLTDQRALYLGFTVVSKAELRAPIVPRDDTLFQDWVGVLLDTYQDGQRAFGFRVSARGVQADGIYVEGGDFWDQDLAWDEVWDSGGQPNAGGYTAEMAIPWRSLRYPRASSQVWGIVLEHFRPNPWAVFTWPELSQDASSTLGQAATIIVDAPPPAGLNLELQPTLVGRLDGIPLVSGVDPGLGAKIGITSSLTADLTANPDFSQIEADADQVTANVKYPLDYDEKRPFFLEGADLFETPLNLTYTRSIVNPLAGYKLTGRAGPVGIGFVGGWDETPAADTISVDYATGRPRQGWDDSVVDGARALDHVARLRVDLGDGAGVGVLASDKELLLADGSWLGHHLGAADADLPFAKRFVAHGQAAWSTTDLPDGSTLYGPAAKLSFEQRGEDFSSEWTTHAVSSEFRAENGFLRDVGRVGTNLSGEFHFHDVGAFSMISPGVEGMVATDLSGRPVDARLGPEASAFVGPNGYVQTEAFYIHERYLKHDFDRWTFNGFSAIDPSASTVISLAWDIGPVPHYAAETDAELFLGFGYAGELGASAALWQRLTLSGNLIVDDFRATYDGPPIYDTFITRLKANLNITRPLSVRVIEEWNTFDRTLDSSALLAFELHPGTAAYLGYTDEFDLAAKDWSARSIFAKVSWLWRPGAR